MNTNEIKIIGVGGAGQEVLEQIPFGSIKNTDYIVCDINAEGLAKSSVEHKILLETDKVKLLSIQDQIRIGMDTVINTEVDFAMNIAINNFEQLDSLFNEHSQTVILISHLGDSTGAGITPVIAQISKKRKLFVVGIVYTPFDFQSEIRKKITNKSLKKLQRDCDFVITVNYSQIGKLYGKLGFKSSFRKANDIIIRLTKIAISANSYSLNPDKTDSNLFFKKNQNNKAFFIGIGEGNGIYRAKDATEMAIKNTLSEKDNFQETSNTLIQINHGSIKTNTDEIEEIKSIILGRIKNKGIITLLTSEEILIEDKLSIIIIAY